MTELKKFKDMLERAGIGHGMRPDFNPPGTGVQVEGDDTDDFVEFWFDDQGVLKYVLVEVGDT